MLGRCDRYLPQSRSTMILVTGLSSACHPLLGYGDMLAPKCENHLTERKRSGFQLSVRSIVSTTWDDAVLLVMIVRICLQNYSSLISDPCDAK